MAFIFQPAFADRRGLAAGLVGLKQERPALAQETHPHVQEAFVGAVKEMAGHAFRATAVERGKQQHHANALAAIAGAGESVPHWMLLAARAALWQPNSGGVAMA